MSDSVRCPYRADACDCPDHDRPEISEAEAERMADRMVWNRLERSRAYRHAASAEAQAAEEDRIAATVWSDIRRRWNVK